MFIRRLFIILAAVAAVGSTAAVPAHAKRPSLPGKTFLIYVKGSQKTTFSKPEHETYENACNRFSGSSSASEAITYHSVKPERVQVMTSPFLLVSYATDLAHPDAGSDLTATITRHSKTITTVTKKSGCGEPASSTTHGGSDCGTRKPGWYGALQGGFGKATLSVLDAFLASEHGYDDCDVIAPDTQFGISPQTGRPTEIRANVNRAKLAKLKKGGRLIVNARKTFDKSTDASVRKTQTVTWQVRLLRVR